MAVWEVDFRPFESAMNRPFDVAACLGVDVFAGSVSSSVIAFISSFCSISFAVSLCLSSLI